MIKDNKLFQCVFIFVSMCSLATAGGVPAELMAQLVTNSGLEESLRTISSSYPQQFTQGLREGAGGGEISEDLYIEIEELCKHYFSEAELRASVDEHLSRTLKREDVESALSWFKTPLGAKISELEATPGGPEEEERHAAFSANMATNPPLSTRIDLVRELDRITHSTEAVVTFVINMQRGVSTALVGMLGGSKEDLDKISDQYQALREILEAQLSPAIMVSMLYTYRTLSDEELEKYIARSRSVEQERVSVAILAAIDYALTKSSRDLGAGIGTHLKESRGRSQT